MDIGRLRHPPRAPSALKKNGVLGPQNHPHTGHRRTDLSESRAKGEVMTISYTELVEAEREGQMYACLIVAREIRALSTREFGSVNEALEVAAKIVESVAHATH